MAGSGGALLDKPEDVNCTLDGAHHIIWMLTNLLDEVTMDTNSYSGNYTCTAVNQLTSVSRTFKASVIGKSSWWGLREGNIVLIDGYY